MILSHSAQTHFTLEKQTYRESEYSESLYQFHFNSFCQNGAINVVHMLGIAKSLIQNKNTFRISNAMCKCNILQVNSAFRSLNLDTLKICYLRQKGNEKVNRHQIAPYANGTKFIYFTND